jgi:hypothetical protein
MGAILEFKTNYKISNKFSFMRYLAVELFLSIKLEHCIISSVMLKIMQILLCSRVEGMMPARKPLYRINIVQLNFSAVNLFSSVS